MYAFDAQKWKKSTAVPPMAIARNSPAVLSLDKTLIVAGGNVEGGRSTNAVEIFRQVTSQWHQAATLPKACCNMSLVSSGDTVYILGGYNQPSLLNLVLYSSIDNLLQAKDPTKPVWGMLQSTPSYQPPAAMLYGNLLAIGGWTVAGGKVARKNVYMYSATTDSWVYFSDLPEPCAWTTCAVLSATEILVIGGRNEENVRAVYKGTMTVKA